MVDSRQQWKAWLYLLPALILLAVFTVYPIINTVKIALLEGYQPLGAMGGELYAFGFSNFSKVIHYKDFLTCLKNTVILCVTTVPLSCFLALIVAVCLNSIKYLGKVLQTIYFLPYVTNTIAIGMVFAMMFNIVGLTAVNADTYQGALQVYNIYTNSQGEHIGYVAQSWGIINNIIQAFGGNPINWINAGVNINRPGANTYIANITVMIVYIVWNALPFKILILLGGLQGVNKQYYDAAKIDGASKWRVFWRITCPLLSPMIAYVVITGFIGGFKEYSSVVGIFGEDMGPAGNGSLMTIVGYIYKAISSNNYGTASAASLILFGIILLVTLVNLYVSSKKVHY
ncbi:MAG: sugar ABC transporter permease [Bacillales bacterium]|nr:sugar ABC transporter permease [Bacillales bacterium]